MSQVVQLGRPPVAAVPLPASTSSPAVPVSPEEFTVQPGGRLLRPEAVVMPEALSARVSPAHWTALAEKCQQLLQTTKEGIIVTVDAPAAGYAAAALAFAFGDGLDRPIVVVPETTSGFVSGVYMPGFSPAETSACSDIREVLIQVGNDALRATRARPYVQPSDSRSRPSPLHFEHALDAGPILRISSSNTLDIAPSAMRGTTAGQAEFSGNFTLNGMVSSGALTAHSKPSMFVSAIENTNPHVVQLTAAASLEDFEVLAPHKQSLAADGRVLVLGRSQPSKGLQDTFDQNAFGLFAGAVVVPCFDLPQQVLAVKIAWALGKLGDNFDAKEFAALLRGERAGEFSAVR